MSFVRLSHNLARRAVKDVWIIGSVWYQSLVVEMVEFSFSGKDLNPKVRTEELLEWGEAFNIMNQIGVVFVLFQLSAAEKLKLQNVVRPLHSTVQWTILHGSVDSWRADPEVSPPTLTSHTQTPPKAAEKHAGDLWRCTPVVWNETQLLSVMVLCFDMGRVLSGSWPDPGPEPQSDHVVSSCRYCSQTNIPGRASGFVIVTEYSAYVNKAEHFDLDLKYLTTCFSSSCRWASWRPVWVFVQVSGPNRNISAGLMGDHGILPRYLCSLPSPSLCQLLRVFIGFTVKKVLPRSHKSLGAVWIISCFPSGFL